MNGIEGVRWSAFGAVEKFDADQTAWAARKSGILAPTSREFSTLKLKPFETIEGGPNLITTAGLNRVMSLLIGSGQAATNTSARIGVGNSTTAAAVGQTDLQAAAGASNRYFQPMDATFPSVSAATVTFKATFASSNGNFAWQEWCVDIGTPTVAGGTTVNALMLNRKVQSFGTKASGASWVLTVTSTLA